MIDDQESEGTRLGKVGSIIRIEHSDNMAAVIDVEKR